MINFFKKKKEQCDLYSPVNGKTIALENVADKVFASKMMGDGIAFTYDGDTVCAPCDGEITMLTNTLHAFGIKSSNGAEVLVHIGLDTVNLEGQGFTKISQLGNKVKAGDPIIKIDREFMASKNIDLTTPVVVTNSSEFDIYVTEAGKDVKIGVDKVITFK